jgi:hypothetical protein
VVEVGTVRVGVSAFLPAFLPLLFALSGCNPPDVGFPRQRPVVRPLPPGAAGSDAAPGTAGTGVVPVAGSAGTGGELPLAGSGGTGTAGMVVGGTGVPMAGAGSSGGVGGVGAPRVFDAGTDPNRNAVMAGTICARLATIQCAGEAYCCDNPGRDVSACETDVRGSCQQDGLVDDIAADPKAAFDAAQALVVFTELERLASQCDPAIAAFGEAHDGLRSIFRGTVAAGGDCRPSNVLSMDMAAAALASCTDHRSQACVPSLSSWTCTPHSVVGGHCFSDINCQLGLYCDNPDFSLSGADCAQRKPVGTSCMADNECQSLFCRGRSCVAADAQAAYCLAAAP